LASRDLAARCHALGHRAHDGGSVATGLALAAAAAQPNDLILVCGSLFAVGEARARLLPKTFEPFRG
ncbi:MAG TPA: bifunctional folylpolyglutamate synthase/dihydrofolate synthase, partial [Geobacteraceae bacterium]|nr:bifunctional folylpolyglutamate synthase/dihydrofolate synthase [Geobacteraceae bacterium]